MRHGRIHPLVVCCPFFLAGALCSCGDSGSSPSAAADSGHDADAGKTDSDSPPSDASGDVQPDIAVVDAHADSPDALLPEGATDAACPPIGGAWSIATVDSDPGFKARVAVAVGNDDLVRLAYNVATSSDGWSNFELRVAEQTSQGFEKKTVVPSEQGVSAEFPTLAVDDAGTMHVVYNQYMLSEKQIEVFMLSGSLAGGFGSPVNLTQTAEADENGAVVALGPDGTLHVVFMQRVAIPDKPGKFDYATGYVAVDGSGPKDRITLAEGTLLFSGVPEQGVAVDGAGRVHVVYLRPGTDPSRGVLHHRVKDASGWSAETAITADGENVTGISVAASDAGKVFFTYGKGKVDVTMTYRSLEGATLSPEVPLTSSTQDRPYYLGLRPMGADGVFLTFLRLVNSNADVFFLSAEQDVFGAEEAITQTPAEDETVASLAVGRCGEAHVGFVENLSTAPHGRVLLATRK
jgi:hypothetical protein